MFAGNSGLVRHFEHGPLNETRSPAYDPEPLRIHLLALGPGPAGHVQVVHVKANRIAEGYGEAKCRQPVHARANGRVTAPVEAAVASAADQRVRIRDDTAARARGPQHCRVRAEQDLGGE